MFKEFTYIILEWLVNTHIKWLNSARLTSWALIRLVLHLWSQCFTSSVCWALCTPALRIFPGDPGVGGLWKMLFQSSSTHFYKIASSHHAFGWKVTFTLRSHCFFSAGIIRKVHVHLQKWLIGRCTGVFQGLICH